jgi:hypothetical protein
MGKESTYRYRSLQLGLVSRHLIVGPNVSNWEAVAGREYVVCEVEFASTNQTNMPVYREQRPAVEEPRRNPTGTKVAPFNKRGEFAVAFEPSYPIPEN